MDVKSRNNTDLHIGPMDVLLQPRRLGRHHLVRQRHTTKAVEKILYQRAHSRAHRVPRLQIQKNNER